jgi:Peptidase family M23
VDGQAVDSRRYAIDWKQVVNGTSFSADPRDVHSYYSYGKSVLAVADGRVLVGRDSLPDNIPGHGEAFHPVVPITLETVAGNTITLDLGDGQFAYYLHLQPGSLRVKTGDRVRRGQVLGSIGASGDAREPHCILKSRLPRGCWLARACPISSTGTVARTQLTEPMNFAYASCPWTRASFYLGQTTVEENETSGRAQLLVSLSDICAFEQIPLFDRVIGTTGASAGRR